MIVFRLCAVIVLLSAATGAHARDFHLEKQKLKLSYEYENYVSISGSEIFTPGLKAAYFLKGSAGTGKRLLWNFDLQSGLKVNLKTDFNAGDLSRFYWTNRASASVTVPWNKFYVGGTFYFRNKWLSYVPPAVRFVDIFGGEGYIEATGGLLAGYVPAPRWDISGAVQASDLQFPNFRYSNSKWKGGLARVTHTIGAVKVNASYRYRSVNYDRPAFIVLTDVIVNTDQLQHDRFWEIGGNAEFYRFVYFSGGYYYQRNNSNSPGFTYRNNRFVILIGTDLHRDLHLQAFGILSKQNFPYYESPLELPLFLDENENTMAVSLTKTLKESSELELGFMRLTNYSSFHSLNASKNILYAAFNHLF